MTVNAPTPAPEPVQPDRTVVFLVGAPRSGTTYLQNLLGAHPWVATSQETDLFTHYIASLNEQWRRQLPSDQAEWARARHKGLPAVLTQEEFDLMLSAILERVYSATLALKPTASVVLDKTPHNGRHVATIFRYLPDARFIHIVRDARDVVSSQLRAARSWGSGWAAAGAVTAAGIWRDDVLACRSIAQLTEAYFEVRYEELVSEQGAQLLQAAWEFCGVATTREEACRTHNAFALADGGTALSSLVWGGEVTKRLGSAPPEPPGFAGEGGVGAWRRDLDERARVGVEREVGDLLRSLAYTDSADWVATPALRRKALEAAMLLRGLMRSGRRRLVRALGP